jgi:hypothetical protein
MPIGGCSRRSGAVSIWLPDNLKSGITTPNRYEPEVNWTYAELAQHYGAVVIPARSRAPKDKAHASYCTSGAGRDADRRSRFHREIPLYLKRAGASAPSDS